MAIMLGFVPVAIMVGVVSLAVLTRPESRKTGLVQTAAETAERPRDVRYVSAGGNDSYDGDYDHPWATIRHADELAKPGTTIVVMDGTYRGDVQLRSSGTHGHPITYVAQHKWRAHIIGTSSGDGSVVVGVSGGHVIIKDFEITGTDANGIILADTGVRASFNQAVGNYVHDMVTPCSSNGGTAIETGGGDNYSGVSHNDIIGNLVVNITPSRECHEVHPASGLFAEIPYSLVANNIIINAGYGIQSWHAATNVTIFGNTLVNNGRAITIGAGDSPGGRINDYSLVQNNIIYNSSGTAIAETGATGPHNVYVHNLIYGGDTSISLNSGLQAVGTIYADPYFVHNTGNANGDYRLQTNSPARASGVALSTVVVDFWGTGRSRAGAEDLGAFVFGSKPTAFPPQSQASEGGAVVEAGASARPNVITQGQSSVLVWNTHNATTATLNGTPVGLNGTMTVHPMQTTTYKIMGTDAKGKSDWGAVTITVR